jgi:hypothetical protein
VLDIVTGQGNELRFFDLTPFSYFLKPGTNSIAVLLRNTWSDYDDIAFDLRLQAITRPRPTAVRFSVQCPAPNSSVLSAETPAGTIWQIQSSEDISDRWQWLHAFTNSAGLPQSFRDTRDGGTPSSGSPARFYRLLPF